MVSTVGKPIKSELKGFEESIRVELAEEGVGVITAGSSRKAHLRTYKNVRLSSLELDIREFKTDFDATGIANNYAVNLFCEFVPNDKSGAAKKALTIPIYTNGTNSFNLSKAAFPIELTDVYSTAVPYAASPGFGGTGNGTLIAPLDRAFKEITVGLEFLSGTGVNAAGGFTFDGYLRVHGQEKTANSFPQPYTGYDATGVWGTSVTVDPVNATQNVTLSVPTAVTGKATA